MTIVPFGEPFERFTQIFAEAERLPREWYPDPNAMTVSTVGADGRPSSRVVLLKSFDKRGFVFFTNFEGRKGIDLLARPVAALCFHWPPLDRQVRIEGDVVQVLEAEADAYFGTRPRVSQLGAWASSQSRPMQDPADLQRRLDEVIQQYEGKDVPRPPYWSGFRVVPQRIEFWHARPNRLHERQVYFRDDDGWRVEQLYP